MEEAERETVEIYHKDYRRLVKPIEESEGNLENLKEIGADVKTLMGSCPTIINPIGKINYEYLLRKFDALVEQREGQITGTINYKAFDATIRVVCPCFEFYKLDDEWELLRELRERAIYVSFSHAENNDICLEIWIDYFYTLCDDEMLGELLP